VRPSGRVACWGANDEGQLGDGTRAARAAPADALDVAGAIEVAAHGNRTCALTRAGDVLCWGGGAPRAAKVPGVEGAAQISIGWWHACAALRDGRAVCWGPAWLGDGVAGSASGGGPALVQGVADAVGVSDSCVLRRSGEVLCWNTETLALAPDQRLPPSAEVQGVADAIAVSGDLILRATGEVWAVRPLDAGYAADPVAPGELRDAVALAEGNGHACAVRATGEIACWGNDDSGQLGAGARARSERPTRVIGSPAHFNH
jgi:alpha-tubulin suppressor-like RCC1 family protein